MCSICFVCVFLVSVETMKQTEFGDYWTTLDDPYGNSFSPLRRSILSIQMQKNNERGLPKCTSKLNTCRHIGIVGAGISGLFSGILLAQSGHRVSIREANSRAGGRVVTHRDERNPSLYKGEFGAMRFASDIDSYTNVLIRQRYRLNSTQFVNWNGNARVYLNEISRTFDELKQNPDGFQFDLNMNERNKV